MLARGIPAVLGRNVAPVFVRVGSFLAVARLGPHAGKWLIYATVQGVDLANANLRRVEAVLNQRSSTADRVVFGIGANVGFWIMAQKAGVRLLPSVACGSHHVMKDRCGPIGIFHRVWSAPYHLNGVLHDTPGACFYSMRLAATPLLRRFQDVPVGARRLRGAKGQLTTPPA